MDVFFIPKENITHRLYYLDVQVLAASPTTIVAISLRCLRLSMTQIPEAIVGRYIPTLSNLQ